MTPLTVFMAAHPGDKTLALQLMKWIAMLGCCKSRSLTLVLDKAHEQRMQPLQELAAKAFGTVSVLAIDSCPWGPRWPRPQNWAFLQTLQWPHQGPFLWLEPDAFPTKQGWLDSLEAEYTKAGKPYMGTVVKNLAPPLPPQMLQGVAIYPPDALKQIERRIINESHNAWDVSTAASVVPLSHDSEQFQHVLKPVEGAKKLTDLRVIKPATTLLHGDKFGNLCRMLMLQSLSKVQIGIPSQNTTRLTKCEEKNVTPDVCIIQLGRIGDILNVLPIAKHASSTNGHVKVPFVIHESMAGVLDRVGYVAPILWSGDIDDPDAVHAEIVAKYREVVRCQLFSKSGIANAYYKSYNNDQYRMAKRDTLYKYAFLEIDRRNYAEERRWLSGCSIKQPFIAVNLTGISSPFPHASKVIEVISRELPNHNVLYLDSNKATSFTDQLIALDSCDALVTVDTATLHLSSASSCPTFAFISNTDNNDWYGTEPLIPVAWSCRYRDVQSRLGEFARMLKRSVDSAISLGRIVHAVSRRLSKLDRVDAAVKSWELMYATGIMEPRHIWATHRSAKSKGDPRELPYLKDVLQAAMRGLGENDVILFNNDDVQFGLEYVEHIRRKLRHVPIVTSSRVDYKDCNRSLTYRHAGRDAFAVRVGWLTKNIDTIPDFVLGASEWDIVLAALVREHVGVKTTAWNLWHNCGKCETPIGLLTHQHHEETWNRKDNEHSFSQKHNRMLAEEWIRHHCGPQMTMHWFNRI